MGAGRRDGCFGVCGCTGGCRGQCCRELAWLRVYPVDSSLAFGMTDALFVNGEALPLPRCHAERSEASPSEARLTGESSLAFGMTARVVGGEALSWLCSHAERREAIPSEARLTGDSSLAFGMTAGVVGGETLSRLRSHAERSEASPSEARLPGDSSLAFGMTAGVAGVGVRKRCLYI